MGGLGVMITPRFTTNIEYRYVGAFRKDFTEAIDDTPNAPNVKFKPEHYQGHSINLVLRYIFKAVDPGNGNLVNEELAKLYSTSQPSEVNDYPDNYQTRSTNEPYTRATYSKMSYSEKQVSPGKGGARIVINNTSKTPPKNIISITDKPVFEVTSAHHYTMQLMGARSQAKLVEYIDKHNLAGKV